MAELDRQVLATLGFIFDRYPIFAEGKPLAVGTRQKLMERHPDMDIRLLRSALLKHCKRPRYLKALAAIPERYDLDGNIAGAVTAGEREKARRDLQKHREHEQAVLQRRLEHTQRELEALRRKADKLKARELQQARGRSRKTGKSSHNAAATPRPRPAPAPLADAGGQRRPVIIVKKRQRSSDKDYSH